MDKPGSKLEKRICGIRDGEGVGHTGSLQAIFISFGPPGARFYIEAG
jgi:hypothetical protein